MINAFIIEKYIQTYTQTKKKGENEIENWAGEKYNLYSYYVQPVKSPTSTIGPTASTIRYDTNMIQIGV